MTDSIQLERSEECEMNNKTATNNNSTLPTYQKHPYKARNTFDTRAIAMIK